ncbi:hypothetical protein J4558_16195 [Leptolyngbya sp. 15MV]|nr:hypothetical protein J4558_16195 [Leptolyngbya sp. 15MV]
MTHPLGLVAGGGLMPLRVADAAQKTGRGVHCLLLEGFAEPADYAAFPHETVPLGQIGRMLAALRARRIQDIVLAGKVKRPGQVQQR